MLTKNAMEKDLEVLFETLRDAWAYLDWNIERNNLDFDQLWKSSLAEVPEETSHKDFSVFLKKIVAQLGDGHSGVWTKNNSQTKRLMIEVRLIDDGVYIFSILDEKCWDLVPPVGGQIIAINNKLIGEIISEISSMTSASTKYNLKAKIATEIPFFFGNCPRVSLDIMDSNGTVKTYQTTLGLYKKDDPITLTKLNKTTAIVNVPSFVPSMWLYGDKSSLKNMFKNIKKCKRMIDEVFTSLEGNETIILDLRGNVGGTDVLAMRIAAYLLSRDSVFYMLKAKFSRFYWENNMDALKKHGNFLSKLLFSIIKPFVLFLVKRKGLNSGWNKQSKVKPLVFRDLNVHRGSIILLIDEFCFSTADNFIASLVDQYPDIITIGKNTGGGTGAPAELELPSSKIIVTFCTMKVYRPNGQLIEGIGTAPDIEVDLNIDNLRQGNDPVLDVALQIAENSDRRHLLKLAK